MGRVIQMLAAVENNDEASLEAGEIADIDAKGMLSSEFEAAELATPQMAPKERFGLGLVLAQSTSEVNHPMTRP